MDFGNFYQATSHRTLRYAYGLTGDLQQAQDVTQEAYARAWQRWRQVSAYDNIEAWLRLVVNRLVQDWWRHLRVRSQTRLESPPAIAAPSEDAVMLAAALKQLPKAQSRALALYYLLDLPVAEIAAETGVSDNTVRSWLARGRAGLANRLRDEADAASVPPVQDVAEAGRHRRRTRVVTTVTAAGLAVLMVLGIAMAVIRTKRPDHPVTPAPTGTTLRRIGEPVPFRGMLNTLIADGRVFVAANDGGTLQVTALDARSGRRLWTQPVPGTHAADPRLSAVSDALVVTDLIDEPSQSSPQRDQMTVLDAATGVTRWQHELSDPDGNGPQQAEYTVFTSAVAFMVDDDSGAIRALDWRTGQTRWTLPGSGRLMMEAAPRTGGNVESLIDGPSLEIASPTFYRAESGGVLREYTVKTGRPTGHAWRGVPKTASARSFVFRGKFYLVTDTQLTTFNLGGDGPSVSYSAHPTAPGTRETVRLWDVQPCAGNAICLIDGGNPEEERSRNPYQVVMLRPGAAPATHDLDTEDIVVSIGDTVYMARGDIFDSRLRVMKPAELAGTLTIGVDDGKAVLVRDEDGQNDGAYHTGPLHLWTFDAATGAVVDLGGLTVVSLPYIVGEHRLLAVTANGVELYAYEK